MGSSGSGKSTLLNILCGVVKPSHGTLKVNDKQLSNYQDFIFGRVGFVPQIVGLANKSVLENVAFDVHAKRVDSLAVKRALEQANALDFVMQLKEGLNTKLADNGADLSGGQRQRLALARALYRNADVIVLDEATNALDKATEKMFFDTMRKISTDKIIVLVSHDTNIQKFCENCVHL